MSDDQKDAERYRWLRQQTWWKSPVAIVREPKDAIKLGFPTLFNGLLDDFIDDQLNKEKTSP